MDAVTPYDVQSWGSNKLDLNKKIGDAHSSATGEGKEKQTIARQKLSGAVVQRVIRKLQQMQDSSMLLSGQDSGLRDVWDEICVQCQSEESIHWPAYEATIWTQINATLDDYSHNQLCELWFLTEAGWDWRFENPEGKRPALCKSDVVEFCLSELLNRAQNHTNARIRNYCDGRYE